MLLTKNVSSDTESVLCGVPQGSVLGPLLFIIYTNDLPNSLTFTKAILFADDTTIFCAGKDKKVLFNNLNHDLVKLIDWFRTNKLSLNFPKTNYIYFKPKYSQNDDDSPDPLLSFGADVIERKQNIKILGLYIDENLQWSNHISHLVSKLSKSNFILKTANHILNIESMLTLYYSLVYSHINYGIALWGPSTNMSNINTLVKVQKRVVRTVKNASYNAHTHEIFKELNILKLPKIIDLELLKLIYLFIHKDLPSTLHNIFTLNSQIHVYDTRHKNDPRNFKHKTATFNKSFLNKGPTLWSEIPNEYKCKFTIKCFSKKIKKYLLDKY